MAKPIPEWQQTYLEFEPEENHNKKKKAFSFREVPINGVRVQFPFQPYPAQIQLMAKIVQALKKSENALLESPTGSGKSLAILCGALAWREFKIKEVYEKAKLERESKLEQESKLEASKLEILNKLQSEIILEQSQSNTNNIEKIVKQEGTKMIDINKIKLEEENNVGKNIIRQEEHQQVNHIEIIQSVNNNVKKVEAHPGVIMIDDGDIHENNKTDDNKANGIKKKQLNGSSNKSSLPTISINFDDDDFQPAPIPKKRKTKVSAQPTKNNNTEMVPCTNVHKNAQINTSDHTTMKDDDNIKNNSLQNNDKIKIDNIDNSNTSNPNSNNIDKKLKEDIIEDNYIIKNKITSHIDLTPSSSSSPPPLLSPSSNIAERIENVAGENTSTSIEYIPKIYVCSRTHKQIEQLIHELKDYTNYRPRMTILGSRDQMCIHGKISKEPNKSEKCIELLDEERCFYGNGTKKLLGHDKFKPNAIWDIEEVIKLGKAMGGCPYYTTRSLFDRAELIFCPYNYVIDPIIRDVMKIKIKDNIIIFDEAHNIEDISREVGSFEVTEIDLLNIQKELDLVIRGNSLPEEHEIMRFLINILLEWILEPNNTYTIKEYEKHIHIWTGNQITNKLQELQINSKTLNDTIYPAFSRIKKHAEEARNDSERHIRGKTVTNTSITGEVITIHIPEFITLWALRHIQGLLMIFKFLFIEEGNRAEDYSMVLIKKIQRTNNFNKDDLWVHKLGFWCHNPGVIFDELSSAAHSLILTSGTLSPLDTFAGELETNFSATVEANHVIHPSQVWIGSIPVGPNSVLLKGIYTALENFRYQDDIGESILSIVNTVPFGVLCFMPSYSSLHKLINRWKSTGIYEKLEAKKKIFIEPQGDNKRKFKKLLQDFYGTIKEVEDNYMFTNDGVTGALFFAVYRGKISEGIDFTDNNCRAVIAVGIPYPNIKDTQVGLKKKYNDDRKSKHPYQKIISGSDWYAAQAFRAINQAIGRCIRHKNDWGAIILLEERFTEQRNIRMLSKWVRRLCKVQDKGFNIAMQDLDMFIQNRLDIERGLSVSVDS